MKNSAWNPDTPQAPEGLSEAALAWWDDIAEEYGIDDPAGLLILQTALEAYDRMRAAGAELDRDGPTVVDRFGQKKPHPAAAVERDARAAMLRALRDLNLDIEPLRDRPGRPPAAS